MRKMLNLKIVRKKSEKIAGQSETAEEMGKGRKREKMFPLLKESCSIWYGKRSLKSFQL